MANAAGPAPEAASSTSLPPLPPGWTENKAPSGHTYYYNAQTRESTYRRPAPLASPPLPPPANIPAVVPVPHSRPYPAQPAHGPQAPAPFLRLSDPRVANAFMAQQNASSSAHRGGGFHGNRGGRQQQHSQRPRHQPVDKPRSRIPIPGSEPWVLVYTKYGRRFIYNTAKNASYWRIPEKLLPAILELDKAGIRHKAQATQNEKLDEAKPSEAGDQHASKGPIAQGISQENDSESEYEEVEVTDDGEEFGVDEDEDGNRRKRQRTEDAPDDDFGDGDGRPVEFSEADIAFQLQAAAEEEGLEWDEGGHDLSERDASESFKDLLDDFQINPFSSWEKLIEEGKIFDDERYVGLKTMKERKAVWEEWSRDTIRERKEQKAKEDESNEKKTDPRTPYLNLLQKHATPKLYWAEFKRKYRKEPAMKDTAPPKEKEKEKLYRDYVARRKLPSSTLKADLTKLLDSLPRSKLNNQTDVADLPSELACDLRYVSLEPKVRDTLVEAYLSTAGPPPAE